MSRRVVTTGEVLRMRTAFQSFISGNMTAEQLAAFVTDVLDGRERHLRTYRGAAPTVAERIVALLEKEDRWMTGDEISDRLKLGRLSVLPVLTRKRAEMGGLSYRRVRSKRRGPAFRWEYSVNKKDKDR